MSGELKREQGENFASFTQRQKVMQALQRAEHDAMLRGEHARKQTLRALRRADHGGDFDYSMNR